MIKILNNKKFKKIISVALTSVIVFGIIEYNNIFSNASSNTSSTNSPVIEIYNHNSNVTRGPEDNVPDLVDNYDPDSTLCQKLEYDQNTNVLGLDCDLEERLNAAGILDSELEDMDPEIIEELMESDNILVSNEYYETVENEDEEETSDIDNIETETLDKDRIDSLISDCIQTGSMECDIIPTGSPVVISSSGALKQAIIVSQKKGSKDIKVVYTATWLKQAKYRNIDVCGVAISNASLKDESWSCTHTADYTLYNEFGGVSKKEKKKTKPNDYVIADGGKGVVYQVDLFGDTDTIEEAKKYGIKHCYKNEAITISFKCTVDDTDIKTCNFTSKYHHLKTKKEITPSISFSFSGDLSVGISGSSKNYYQRITRNAYVPYEYSLPSILI